MARETDSTRLAVRATSLGRSLVSVPLALAAVLVIAVLLSWTRSPQAQTAPDNLAELAERLLPAVVNISTTQVIQDRAHRGPEVPKFPPGSPFEEFFQDFFDRSLPEAPPRRATALGSGFIVDPSGYIVTSNHVIEGADEIAIILQDGTNLTAKIIGRDTKTDLALLKVESEDELAFLEWGDSDTARVGDWIIAIGNPFGLGGTVTAGIISARARDINAGPYDDFIQTDASINRGNSGGPMFNLKGEVIGINTAIFSPSGGSVGIGFAIPSALAEPVIYQLREYGRARRGWLGVRVQTVTEEIAENLGLDEPRGALVANVSEGGPAQEAGIEQGDVILRFDGKDVPTMRRLPRVVAETDVEKEVEVVIWRKGEELTIGVQVGELEEAEEPTRAALTEQTNEVIIESLELSLASITPELGAQFGLDADAEGVVITKVSPGSDAARKDLRPGDLILEVNQEEISTPAGAEKRIKQAKSDGHKTVLLLVSRQGDERFESVRFKAG